ncbi:hypothetical protein AB6A40_007352 [Gnathostoma spinigerum]|uniref:LTD domain-containing protein n=1 Tax=Gnathostoma spinigerum TaxID=75299 RepID=A0ABD6EL86_9BILA
MNSVHFVSRRIKYESEYDDQDELSFYENEEVVLSECINKSIHYFMLKEVDRNGTFIVLENTSLRDAADLSDWTVKRDVDGTEFRYTFPFNFILQPTKTVTVWARDQGGKDSPPDSVISYSTSTFGVGKVAKTTLLNNKNVEMARHIEEVLS